jgi:fibronectin type 3 domain-containing protein
VSVGKEECFAVRSVLRVGTVDVESDPVPICVTPRDTFPPAEPKGLSVVAGDGTMKLSWDANAEQDLAGYLVLRGEAPGETLQPLASEPLPGTSFEDKTVKPGVRYVYAIVAVDKATPPNRSGPSPRVEETAR